MRIPIQVRYSDYDDRGHVNNAVYFTYFELGRMEAWTRIAPGAEAGFIVAQAQIAYRSPAMPGDQLMLELSLGELRTKAWVWKYRLLDASDDRLIADGETTQVMYDYATRKSVAISPELREKLASLA